VLGLGVISYRGQKEVKAWTIKKGMKPPRLQVLSYDFEKKFIPGGSY